MSILHTITPSTASSRPRASWSQDVSVLLDRVAVRCASFVYGTPVTDSAFAVVGLPVSFDHMGTNHIGTTGSKRLDPGHLDEVST